VYFNAVVDIAELEKDFQHKLNDYWESAFPKYENQRTVERSCSHGANAVLRSSLTEDDPNEDFPTTREPIKAREEMP